MAFGNEGGEFDDPSVGTNGGYSSGNVGASSQGSADVAGSMGAPSIGGASPAGDLSGGLGDIEASIAADQSAVGGWDFGTPPGGWGAQVTGPSINAQGQVVGSQHAGSAADSFAQAIDALDAAIGAMPSLGVPSTGLSGMGVTGVNPPASPLGIGGEQFDAYSVTPFESYGKLSVPTQEADLAYTQALENFDPMGSSLMGQFGQQHAGPAAPGQTVGPGAAAPSGVMSALGAPNLGFGASPYGEMGAPVNTVDPGLQSAVNAATATGQAPGTDVGMPGYAASMQAQAEAQEADEVGADLAAQDQTAFGADQGGAGVGLTGSPVGTSPGAPATGWGSDITGPGYADPNTTAFDMGPGAAQAEDAMMFDRDKAKDVDVDSSVAAMMEALAKKDPDKAMIDDDLVEDKDEDLSGLPTGMTAEQTNMIVAGLKDAEKGKGFAYALNEIARAYLGLPKSTPESRMKDALANYDAQGKQDQMEMDVSTGEDDRTRMERVKAISNFRKQYKWAKDMSAKEIQAYMDNPALLKLKISNEQMRSMDPKTMTANDIRQLWSPAMSA